MLWLHKNMPKVDDNSEYISLVSDGTNAVPLKVDPVTSRLIIEVNLLAEAARTINQAKIDENSESVSLVKGSNESIYLLLIDSRNGYLLVEIIFT